MIIEDYFQHVEALIAGASIIHSSTLTYDKRSTSIGFIRGTVYLLDGSQLHLREFVNVQHGIDRYMYAYHYQRPDGTLVFRYDNTPHFRALPTFPHHKHEGSEANVVSASAPVSSPFWLRFAAQSMFRCHSGETSLSLRLSTDTRCRPLAPDVGGVTRLVQATSPKPTMKSSSSEIHFILLVIFASRWP